MKIQIDIDSDNTPVACVLFEVSLRGILGVDELENDLSFNLEGKEIHISEKLTVEERRYFRKWFENWIYRYIAKEMPLIDLKNRPHS
ncbi:MAG: hypothetical protein KME13_18375 [Myxacorys californica WJT36-NPBG1]|jgi:hypothetical protein|nr:hypothetical protein [Myxacorys californica WJT36-NPBG1]